MLLEEHRAIEEALDLLAEGIRCGAIGPNTMRAAADLIARHYASEERFLGELELRDRKLAAKLRAQHDEALEISGRVLESLECEDAAETVYLSRRLVAIVEHNIIEEERDVFPLMERIPGPG
jgi:hypothetical protein